MEILLPALVCALLAGVAGWFVPRVIARLPEPELDDDLPDEPPASEEGAAQDDAAPGAPGDGDVKEPYAEIARLPRLALGSAIVSALVAGAFGAGLGWTWPLVYLVPLVPLGVVLAVIDWRTRLLPTRLIAPAYPVLVMLVVLCGVATGDWDDVRRAGLGWLVMGGFYLLAWLVSGRLLGYGDVRLSGLLGIALGYLGWGPLVVGLALAFPMLGVPPLLLALVRRDRSILKRAVPFGPAMLASAALGVVAGAAIGDWYVRTAGLSG